jgi:hypothetical protein
MLGLLVNGDNHFIVRGPLPSRGVAVSLVRHWSVIQIGCMTPPELVQWSIVGKAFREDLEWAVLVPGENDISLAIMQLLAELVCRGITIHDLG